MRKAGLTVAAVVALSCGWSAAGHANLVSNPGFEADFTTCPACSPTVSPPTDWTVGGNGNAGADTSNPNNGLVDGFLIDASLSQVITTVAGTEYTLDFFLAADPVAAGDPDSTFDVTLGGFDPTTASPITGADFGLPDAYTEYTFDIPANKSVANADLVFTGVTTADLGTWYLDDVSVTPVSTSSVPEPSEAMLLVSMLGTLALVRRRRG